MLGDVQTIVAFSHPTRNQLKFCVVDLEDDEETFIKKLAISTPPPHTERRRLNSGILLKSPVGRCLRYTPVLLSQTVATAVIDLV